MDCLIEPDDDIRAPEHEISELAAVSAVDHPFLAREDRLHDAPQSVGKPSEHTAIRTFQASNTLTMRDGQTMLLITATDKVTGELVKIEVAFSVLK